MTDNQLGREPILVLGGAELARLDMTASYVDLVMYLLTTVLDGRNTLLADSVQRALGRAPIDFSDYVRRTAATGIWSA